MLKILMMSAALLAGAVFTTAPALAAESYKVVEGCHYPSGWNVGDFDRDLNGVPNGIHHECIDTYSNGRLVHRAKAGLE